MAVTMAWKVYGAPGHRQRESFCRSYIQDFSENGMTRIIEVENSDKTGTNDYSFVRITRDTADSGMTNSAFTGSEVNIFRF